MSEFSQPHLNHSRRVGIYGASGTSGAELVRLLYAHPAVELVFGTSRSAAGQRLSQVEPWAPPLRLRHPDEVDPAAAELVFLCLPHGSSAQMAERCLDAGCRVVDLSGDLRLRDAQLHLRVYGSPRSQRVADLAVYGLTEYAREALGSARVVANPGCYPTCTALPLAPLCAAGMVPDRGVVIDAKSGVSGAGRSPTATNHFCSVAGDVRPYKVGRAHRHVAEIEQTLSGLRPGRAETRVVFSPHLVPLERGMLCTIVLPTTGGGTAADMRQVLGQRYHSEPFVELLEPGDGARIRAVAGSNRAVIAVHEVEGADAVVLSSAIDNLVKGAAGQAVQNMNLMLGLDETLGLGPVTERA